ncbi:MAG: radical SAM protein, partial [Clostridiales bacterium]|nr:radical SAM protein [Clostridiales bacterium]
MKFADKAKTVFTEAVVKQALGYLENDPETNLPKLMALVDKCTPKDWYAPQRNAIRDAIQNKDSNWYQLIRRLYQLDPGVRKAFFQNFILNASLVGSVKQEANAEE